MSDPRARLEALLLDAEGLSSRDLRARLQWLENVVLAADALDLDDEGRRGATDLKAGLGAIIRFSQGPMDEAAVAELRMISGALLARGLASLLRSLAGAHRTIASTRGAPMRGEAGELSAAFEEAARDVEQGRPPSDEVRRRIAAAKRAVDGRT